MVKEWEFSTRKIIMTMLKKQGAMSVNDVAKVLGITEMAVRRHLNTLERDGLVEAELVRQPMGRPTHLYSLTELADDFFPKNYHQLTLDLLGELTLEEGEQVVEALFERRKQKLFDKYEQQMTSDDLSERVSALAQIQNANGYMAEWEQSSPGQYVLQEFNCPISQVANRYQQACKCELTLFEKLLQAKVERTECLAKGGNKCVYKIQEKAASK
jgi:predicted ArsR family transcriptional regulator